MFHALPGPLARPDDDGAAAGFRFEGVGLMDAFDADEIP